MSYDISLIDPVSKNTLEVEQPHFMHGGNYAMNGTKEMWLNVTYNYYDKFAKAFGTEEGIHVIENKSAVDTIPVLENAINALGDDTSGDYWESTEGNAKKALVSLLTMAKMRPDGVWKIS